MSRSWSSLHDKLRRLRALDQTCQVFGADRHEYQLRPLASPAALETKEHTLGTSLPPALRRFYMKMGDGGAGPKYGMWSLDTMRTYRPAEPYPGVAHYRQQADVDDTGYFEVSHDVLRGLLALIPAGCGHEVCVVSTGPAEGQIVHVSLDGFVHEADTDLMGLYEQWLDENIAALERVDALLDTDRSLQEIDETITEEFGRHDAHDLAVSRIGAEKPAALFGSGTTRRYHAASQMPWYRKQVAEYRGTHASNDSSSSSVGRSE